MTCVRDSFDADALESPLPLVVRSYSESGKDQDNMNINSKENRQT